MAPHQDSCSKTFAPRYFYNSSFVHSQLLDSNHIQKLKSMCRYVKPNVLYSDVLKKSKDCDGRKQSDKTAVKCFDKTPEYGKIDGGRSVTFHSSSIKSPKKPVTKRAMLKSQCVSHMCRHVNNIVKSKSKHEIRSQFVDDNPYEILADIDFSSVNTCQPVNVNNVVRESDGETCHEASVLMKNGRNLTKGKESQFIREFANNVS